MSMRSLYSILGLLFFFLSCETEQGDQDLEGDDDPNPTEIDTELSDCALFKKIDNAPFPERAQHTVVLFKDKLWLIGGEGVAANGGSEYYNDVWSSEDGISWKLETDSPGFLPRYGHSSFVFKNRLWVLGGGPEDVWSSEDGVNWVKESDGSSGISLVNFNALVFRDRIWIFDNGRVQNPEFYRIWSSPDGKIWDQEGETAGYPQRFFRTATVFQDKIWLIGGTGLDGIVSIVPFNDVWSSEDGVTWVEEKKNAAFSLRDGHSVTVHNNKLWLISGKGGTDTKEGIGDLQDIWQSENGVDWKLYCEKALSERSRHSSISFDNNLMVIGGSKLLTPFNDIWALR